MFAQGTIWDLAGLRAHHDRETTHKFLTACYEQHSALGARDKLAAGQSNCTSFNFQSYVCADAVDLFLVIRMEGTS